MSNTAGSSGRSSRPPRRPWTERIIVGERANVEPPEWLVASYETFLKSVLDDRYPCFFGTRAEARGEMFYSFASGDDWRELGATLARFCELSTRPENCRSNLAIFFEPRTQPFDHEAFCRFCWDVLQYLHDGDPTVGSAAQIDADDAAWEFYFQGTQIFVVGASPTYVRRRSRNLGPGIVMLFQPRHVFVDSNTGKAISHEARAEVRKRIEAWDGVSAHPDLGVYGDPANREWKQYMVSDDDLPELGQCPFLDRRRGEVQDRAHDVVTVLRSRAASEPEALALKFLSTRDQPAREMTYRELDRQARRLASEMLLQTSAGERALLALPTGPEYVVAFYACLYAGIVAVPVYPVGARVGGQLERLRNIARDAAPALVLVDAAGASALERLGTAANELVVDLEDATEPSWEPAEVEPTSVAYLQYTSGSTGAPKGVMISHANMMANGAAICALMKLDRQTVLVSWLPLYHDMGLVSGVFLPIYRGFSATLMPQKLLLERPLTWLETIARERATLSGGPDFVYSLCVDRIDARDLAGLDLSSWKVAFCGSEPINPASMTGFAERFQSYGFNASALCPCYGLAEATLMATSCRAGDGAFVKSFDDAAQPLIDCGAIPALHDVTIVDPESLQGCADGRVGEIWLSGPSVAQGYFGNSEATERTFPERQGRDGASVRMLRTGDLGFVRDGRLYVSGRLKDLIIIRGRNVYPQDIEQTLLDAVPGLHRGRIAAFSVPRDGKESVGVAVELASAVLRERGAEALFDDIRKAIAAHHQEQVELIALLKPGQLPRTSSGKLRRSACAEGIERETLRPIAVHRRSEPPPESLERASVPPRSIVEHALANLWSEVLGKRGFGVHDDFFELGGDSLALGSLLARAQRLFGTDLSLEQVFDARTIAQQAALLESPPAAAQPAPPAIEAQPHTPTLSSGQRSLWLLWKLNPSSHAYTLFARLELRGRIDVPGLKRAWLRVVERHAVLRTCVEERAGVPHAVVLPAGTVDWESIDLRLESLAARQRQLDELERATAFAKFDLERSPPLRARLAQLADDHAVLFVGVHHIAADHASAHLLWSELEAAYAAPLEALTTQFADWSRERELRDAGRRESHLEYWKRALGEEPQALELPGRRQTEAAAEVAVLGRAVRRLPSSLVAALGALARQARTTLPAVLLAAFDVLLYRYGGASRIDVGVPMSLRDRPEAEQLIGYFVNLVVHRASVRGEVSFVELASEVGARLLQARAHGGVAFEQVVAAVAPERNGAGVPLVAVSFNYRREPQAPQRSIGEMAIASVEARAAGAPFEWTLDVLESGDDFFVALEYRRELFDENAIEQALADYARVLSHVADAPEARVAEIELASTSELAQALQFCSFAERFRARVAVAPAAVAVACAGETLTYGQLGRRAEQIASELAERGVVPGQKIGLALERSCSLVAAVVGVLLSGATLVPLDPGYPALRLEQMMDDAAVRIVLTDGATAPRLRSLPGTRELLEITLDERDAPLVVARAAQPEQVAYVMFTSGSTGRPKGVEISQRALSLHIDDYLSAFAVTSDDAVLAFSTINFDAAVEQLLPILTLGGRIVLRGPEVWTWEQLNRVLEREGVTLAYLPSGYFRQWLAHLPASAPPALRLVTIGAEAISGGSVAAWRASPMGALPLWNTYGPTEATVTTSAHVTTADDVSATVVPIGKSLAGRRSIVVGQDGVELPTGGVGELCIGGAALAQGYLAAPALTAERFVPDASGLPGARLYRTGDRVRRRADGTHEFLGRLDDQVKLRGHRIELGEIEAALRRCEGVNDAVAVLAGRDESARLVAYVVGSATSEQLRGELARVLPTYMVPTAIVPLDAIPLLPNGKRAIAALPSPALPTGLGIIDARTPPEEALLRIWRQVLRREDVGVSDDFFASGGDSISVLQVVARARQIGLVLTPRQVFDNPTVERAATVANIGVGAAVHSAEAQVGDFAELEALGFSKSDVEDVYPATTSQQGLLFHDAFERDQGIYVHQVRVRLRGDVQPSAMRAAWQMAVTRHDALRSVFVWTGSGGALAAVVANAQLPFFEHDGRGRGEHYDDWLEQWCAADVAQGFDPRTAPLMRVHLVKRPDGAHDLIWTNHHAILDGWSAARLLAEVLEDHGHASRGRSLRTEPGPRFASYARQVTAREPDEAWWRQEVARWDAPATVESALGQPLRSEAASSRSRAALSPALVFALSTASRRARVTASTLFEAAWALVLARYAGRGQALFGVVTSDRPVDVPEVERAIGMFVHTVPVCVEIAQARRADSWLATIQRHGAELRERQGTSLSLIQRLAGAAGRSLFDSVLVFENYPIADELQRADGELSVDSVQTVDRTHYPLTLSVYPRRTGAIELEWEWDGSRVEQGWVTSLSRHLEEVLEQLAADGEQLVGDIELSGRAAQEARSRREFRVVAARIDAQSRARAGARALWCETEWLSYGQLGSWSSAVARRLMAAGVSSEKLVGLCLQRGVGLPAGVLGIWKAGGAVVPLDPSYPVERLRRMLRGVEVVLVDAATKQVLREVAVEVPVVELGECPASDAFEAWDFTRVRSDSLAYVIYTSGSSGEPKGVAVSQGSLSAHVDDFLESYGISDVDTQLFSSTVNFDVWLHEVFPALTQGGRVVMRGEAAWELSTLTERLREQEVTFARVSTAYFGQWVKWLKTAPASELPRHLRQVTTGGEGLSGAVLRDYFSGPLSGVKLDNLYGPTETTVAALSYRTSEADIGEAVVPIGAPFGSRSARVMDSWGRDVPVGGVGELCIGGVTVARGYLGRPSETAERFVPDASGVGARLYRSGDLSRMRWGGTVEFLGRGDEQIKLRGYRIELGEIESALLTCQSVKSAAAAVRGEGEHRRLVGYVTGDVEVGALKSELEQKLPAHLRPSAYVLLASLPLTNNGKLDRKSLPEPAVSESERRLEPRTAAERALQEIWQSVLKLEAVGLDDNYFELGGDSILSLQIIATARQRGWQLTPKQLFEQPTIESLARVAVASTASAVEQGEVLGELPLTPIQARFFEQHPSGPSHYNQSVLLQVKGELDVAALERTLLALVNRHDALRLRFSRRDGVWTQQVQAEVAAPRVNVVALGAAAELAAAGERVQRSLSIEQGPLLRAEYFTLPEGDGRLLLVVHHLAVDGVSWRVLLDELQAGYRKATRAEPLGFVSRSSSFSRWATELARYAKRPDVQREASWWVKTLRQGDRARLERPRADRSYRSSVEVEQRLSASDTQRLLAAAPRAYRLRVDELLLAALTQTLSAWTGEAGLLVHLEGHGREDIGVELDLSGTVGWFTTRYPTWLQAAGTPAAALKHVKEQLRSVPQKGFNFGLLDRGVKPATEPAVSFNYLGRFDDTFDGSGRWSFASESAGSPVDPSLAMSHALDLNATIRGDQLSISWRYSTEVLTKAEVEQLVATFTEELSALVAHCEAASPQWTPTDFPLAATSLGELELEELSLVGGNVRDIYPATALQAGLLFHSLSEPESGQYVYQLRMTLVGRFDGSAWRAAWQAAVDAYETLRTSFVWTRKGVPLQVVHADVAVDFCDEDWRALDDKAFEERLETWLEADRKRGFALDEPSLLRVRAIRCTDDRTELVWAMHHAASDGWASMRVLAAVFADVHASQNSARRTLPTAPRYRDYVAWLGRQPDDSSFWRERLSHVDQPATLGDCVAGVGFGSGARERIDRCPAAQMSRLKQAAQRHRVTLALLLQAAWALVLARHSDRAQVVFGVTVAGRPAELDGSDRMIGPFINSLPWWVDVPATGSIASWLAALQRDASELAERAHTPLSTVQKLCGRPGEQLFDSLLVVENYPFERSALRVSGLELRAARVVSRSHYPLSVTLTPHEELEIAWEWDAARFSDEDVARLAGHYIELLDALCVANHDSLEALKPAPTKPESALHPRPFVGVLERFLHQAETSPGAEALRCGPSSLSYRELERWSSLIATQLIAAGVGREQRVGLCVERSLGLVAAILGIWRAGGAYVPLDPSYPADRLIMMLGDAEVGVVLADAGSAAKLEPVLSARRVVAVELEPPSAPATAEIRSSIHPEQLAYVIYTSGSTGTPKGVAISHRALALHVHDYVETYSLASADRVYQFSTINFDASAEQLFPALAAGACVILRGPETPDFAALNAELSDQRVTVIDLPESYWQGWLGELPADAAALRLVSSGGETMPAAALGRWRASPLAHVRLDNSYGPTEATIAALYHRTDAKDVDAGTVAIGRPFPSRSARLLDAVGTDVADGCAAELCVGGDALARGYQGRPGLTAERFAPDPSGFGARLYRTGDIGRRRAEGSVQLIGRRDRQIKLRGHRVELAEVEQVLLSLPGVRSSAALVRAHQGQPKLVAYVTGDVELEPLWHELRKRLPAYTVPGALQVLPALPTQPNGKLDLQALPDPDFSAVSRRLPATERERRLYEIWRGILGIEAFGIDDDFFFLGGDSITSLLAVSRARAEGLSLTPRQIFEHRTVAALATIVELTEVRHQSELRGPVPLAPIQAWFFEQYPQAPTHYNQSLLLRTPQPLDLAALGQALRAVVGAHDALRSTFVAADGHWRQRIAPFAELDDVLNEMLFEIDLRSAPSFAHALQDEAQAAQRSLKLERGLLLTARQFLAPEGDARLLLVVHHLAIDGVSWRILLDDLESAYAQALAGRAPHLEAVSTPFSVWSRDVNQRLQGSAIHDQLPFWVDMLEGVPRRANPSFSPSSARVERTLELSVAATLRLKSVAPGGADIEAVLLTALAHAVSDDTVVIDLERHGRDIDAGSDTSRSVGWFTAQFPVRLHLPNRPKEALEATRAQLAVVPAGGVGYGLLRYGDSGAARDVLAALPRPFVSFNFMGSYDGSVGGGRFFALANEPAGDAIAPELMLTHALDVNAVLSDGQLRVRFAADPLHVSEGELSALVERFEQRLQGLVSACGAVDDLEATYPATSLQQGLLFHALLDAGHDAYVNQVMATVRGPLDLSRFAQAWNHVLTRHEVLRSCFSWRDGEAASAQVHRRVELPISALDLSGEDDYRAVWSSVCERDRARGLALDQPPLLRLTLARRPDGGHDVLWTSHHALLDGWSASIVLAEVLEHYERGEIAAPPPRAFRDYATWVSSRPSAQAWWQARPERYSEAAGWRDAVGHQGSLVADGSYELVLESGLSERLVELARTWQVTLPAIVQAAWALLLSRFANREQVVFGTTVAGRSAALDGIERMVGLFVNSLPVAVAVRDEAHASELVRAVLEATSELGAYEHTPLHELQGWVGQAGAPLFDSLLIFENYPIAAALEQNNGSLRFERATVVDRTHYPLTIAVRPGPRLRLHWSWRSGVSASTVERAAAQLARILSQFAEPGDVALRDVTLERPAPLVRGFADYRFESVIAKIGRNAGSAPAVRCAGEQLTYAELSARSDLIAARLQARGVGREARVGVCVRRSVALPVALLGVLKANAAYVPLDPTYPVARLSAMLDDAGIDLVVADVESAARLGPSLAARVIVPSEASQSSEGQAASFALSRAHADELAYVLYTSGSTGAPKGVGVTHEALCRFLTSASRLLEASNEQVWLSVTSVSFDIFGLELFLPLLAGACVELAPPDVVTDGPALAALIERVGASHVQATPVIWRDLIESGWAGRRDFVALSGGEALPSDLAAALLERVGTLWNLYGPTETTIWSSASRINRDAPITLGEPFDDCSLTIRDAHGRVAPLDAVGELCIGGSNLARGYLHRAALTAERFVPDADGAPGARAYRTGDRVRRRADGGLEFEGRFDQQIKLRGHRIELGEIESALRAASGVRDAAAVLEARPTPRLVAYVTGEADPVVLRRELLQTLPAQLVPAVIVKLGELPLTLNGKLDRRALPGVDRDAEDEPPRGATELTLADLWAEVLGRARPGRSADFFALGGHSLSALRLAARLSARFGREVPLATIMARPVLADQARALESLELEPSEAISRLARTEPLRASPEQERLWFLWKIEPASMAYAISGSLRFEGDLDRAALREGLLAIVSRHEVLRTRFVEREGGVYQLIEAQPSLGWSERQIEDEAGNAEPFDLEHGPSLRAQLLRRGPGDHVLHLAVHHIAADGASIELLLAELAREYASRVGHEAEAVAPPAIQYADYAGWERRRSDGALSSAPLDYWRRKLGADHARLDLPGANALPAKRSGQGARITCPVSSESVVALDRLAEHAGLTRFSLVAAALNVVLKRYSGERLVRIGVPVSSRRRPELEQMIGLFVDTIVLAVEQEERMSFTSLARSVRDSLLEAQQHHVPFARLVEELKPPRVAGETPLFRVTFNFEESEASLPAFPGLTVTPLATTELTVPFDLMVDASSTSGALRLSLAYATDVFAAADVSRWAGELSALLERVGDCADAAIGDIPALVGWNAAQVEPSVAATHQFEGVLARFARQVAVRPAAVALSLEGRGMTYAELDVLSNGVARRLVERGVERGELVALCLHRGFELIAAMLGVLKAGAAYLPLDADHPSLRLRDTLVDAKVLRVVVDARTRIELEAAWTGVQTLVVAESDAISAASLETTHAPRPDELAYVIYTSGSTGAPKGVGVTHANVARLLDSTRQLGFDERDVWTLFHSPAFDFSVWEIFGALAHGSRLVLVPASQTRDPRAFRQLLAAEQVTILNQTPSAFTALVQEDIAHPERLSPLRAVIFGGEKLELSALVPWAQRYGLERPQLINMYGITETTVHVTQRRLTQNDFELQSWRSVIGAPLDDLELKVLDASLNPAPIGGIGEMYVGGAGVARGYLGRPGLTAARFVPDPCGGGRRLYASGDRARRLERGDHQYLGRSDAQVKIRGYRVELAEIEAALRGHPGSSAAVVSLHKDSARGDYLVAHFVARAPVPTAAELRSYLSERLPSHMVPSAFVALDSLPLTPNGKLDRARLPLPLSTVETPQLAPRTETERVVAAVYEALLGQPNLGLDADFFLLGGHSLLAVRAAANLGAALGRVVEVAAIFHHSTVSALAAHLEAADAGTQDIEMMDQWLDALAPGVEE